MADQSKVGTWVKNMSASTTSKLKRFGDYPTNLNPEPMPTRTTLPL
jgi:hypothetical protein